MSENCQWLHEQLEILPRIAYPFQLSQLPTNGIYFFYEKGEFWGHGGLKQRIVRLGTHKNGNFRSRISEHFLLDESKMNFSAIMPAPHERSIFRKNIGRALLNKENSNYQKVWEIDFTSRKNREKYSQLRDISIERRIEKEINQIFRDRFAFRYIIIDEQETRMGSSGLESAMIGTLAKCKLCRPSENWLGRTSPKSEIRSSGLWLVQHLSSPEITQNNKELIMKAIEYTLKWDKSYPA